MNNIELQYLDLLEHILENGYDTTDRTGTGTKSIFGAQISHDFSEGFPLLTTKRVFWKGVVEELLWMLRGETNVKSLQDKGVRIWDSWCNEDGELGPVYGKQMRSWKKTDPYHGQYRYIDQISEVIQQIKTNPDSRRLIVNCWNVSDLEYMSLPPCHMMFQFKVYGDKLYCQLYQRSADMFLGVPFNIASYSLLTMIIAYMTNLKPAGFIHTFGDAHIYNNHIDQVKEQLNREPRKLPKVDIDWPHDLPLADPSELKFENIVLTDYNPHATIKGEVSV